MSSLPPGAHKGRPYGVAERPRGRSLARARVARMCGGIKTVGEIAEPGRIGGKKLRTNENWWDVGENG